MAIGPARQRGAATLVIVMLLFFVVSLTAAYAARNLIFEQRTSANHYRASQLTEAAESGLQWATVMLNAGRIDASCNPTTDVTQSTFRQRYLSISDVDGFVTAPPLTAAPGTPRWAACAFDGTAWQCSCPGDGALVAPPAPTGAGPFPAFAVRFNTTGLGASLRPGVMRIEVNGCNSFDLQCLTLVQPSITAFKCGSTLCGVMGLLNGVRAPPVAAVTARYPLVQSPSSVSGMSITNADPSTGVTVHTGPGPLPGGLVAMVSPVLQGPAGTPASATASFNDSNLASPDLDSDSCEQCLFTSVFGIRRAAYRDQPAVIRLDCSTACTAATLNPVIASNPGRPIYLEGSGIGAGLSLSSASDTLGSAAAPVVLVIEGGLSMSGGASIFGFVYAERASLSPGRIEGALVSASTVTGSDAAAVTYDRTAILRLMHTSGSFLVVPGSWRDFP
ncbi:MAG: PilX N-terminal domain-containing pilus assembly protein [Rubrivivax sp.]